MCERNSNTTFMKSFSRRILEMESLSLFTFPNNSVGLDNMLSKFELSRPQTHSALEDIKATIELYKKYLELL